MRMLVLGLLAIGVGEVYSSPVLGGWGKQDGSGLLGKVANLSHTVYERKREFLNGVNEKVSRMLWIPPWTTTTTARPLATTTTEAPREVPNADTPNIWWWQTSAKPPKSSTEPVIQSTTSKVLFDEDRLMFTVADTNQLELPNVSMYARSVFIPEELRLTADSDAVEFVEPTIFGRGPPADPDRLIMH
ncbi:uncharacterized protein LOC131210105 [Anopheles bellator]|uniref:uncharacterized protein LOC131210105 n=1 Tax=Anopheles bellator TaxID=139047 RepID=UPI002649261E|nr:uncharacterized protein LOC131210105 [Anopheles bellator]